MKKISCCIAAIIVLATLQAAKSECIVTHDAVLKEILIFSRAPLTEDGRGAAAVIVRFAQESEHVTITLSSAVTPWIGGKQEYKYSEILLAAYIAGNLKSQLERGKNEDDPHAGLVQVFKTYAQLKEADGKFKVPEIDKLMELHSENKLEEYLKNIGKS
jgi:hypothetical protein